MTTEKVCRFWICSEDEDGNYIDHQAVGRKVFRQAGLVNSAFYDTVGTRDGETTQFFELRIPNFSKNVSEFDDVENFIEFLEDMFNQSIRVEVEEVTVLSKGL
jgi:hypothetical protein